LIEKGTMPLSIISDDNGNCLSEGSTVENDFNKYSYLLENAKYIIRER
jgi:hypothetical protein